MWEWQQTDLCHFSFTHVFPSEKKKEFCFSMSGCVCCHVWMLECPPQCLQENHGSNQEIKDSTLIYKKKKKFCLFHFSDEILVFHSFSTLGLSNILCWDNFGSEGKWAAGGAVREQRMVGITFSCCFFSWTSLLINFVKHRVHFVCPVEFFSGILSVWLACFWFWIDFPATLLLGLKNSHSCQYSCASSLDLLGSDGSQCCVWLGYSCCGLEVLLKLL